MTDTYWAARRASPRRARVPTSRSRSPTAGSPPCAPGTAPGDARRLPGVVLPGFANAHSHAFHRALRGRTHGGGGTFWTWREAMYAVAARLDPDSYRALATAAYAEMALAGVTGRRPSSTTCTTAPAGCRYADPHAMRAALRAAAADAGIRLTLLDTCYLAGGFDTPLEGPPAALRRPRRRTPGPSAPRAPTAWPCTRCARCPATRSPSSRRPPRAVPCTCTCPSSPPRTRRASRATGCTPTGLLAAEGVLGPATTAVHATHLTDADIALLGGSGTGVCLCPTHRARPRRRHRPGPRAARRGRRRCRWAATSTPSSTCSKRPGRWRCTSGSPPASAAGSARPSSSPR